MAGTLFRGQMVLNLSETIYLHDFEPFPFDRELSYEKAVFVSGLVLVAFPTLFSAEIDVPSVPSLM